MQDHVVEQHHPAGDEAHELVERVAGEDRRAARGPGAARRPRRTSSPPAGRTARRRGRRPASARARAARRRRARSRSRGDDGVDDREEDRLAERAAEHQPWPLATHSRPAPAATNSTPKHDPDGEHAAARGHGAHDHRDADDEHRGRQDLGAPPVDLARGGHQAPVRAPATAAWRGYGASPFSWAPSDWMITRHGRSASTVSTVLPNSDPPVRGGQRHDDRPARAWPAPRRRSGARACPARTFSQWPLTRRPPWSARLLDDRLGGELLLGHLGVDRRRGRDRDRDEHVDAAPPPGGDLDRRRERALGVRA